MQSSKNTRSDSPQHDDPLTNLSGELQKLEKLFEVNQDKLKQISARFEEELIEGLQDHEQNIPMNITWVLGFPNGQERGSYLAIDLGGTNVRICWITLKGEGKHEMIQDKFSLPTQLKTATADELWDKIVRDLESFVTANYLGGSQEEPLPLAFTFSYPAAQDYIDHGILQTWTKGFDIAGCEGEDIAEQLSNAMSKKNLPIKLAALINDTTGAMIASAYNDPKTIVGAIFGTGCNAAYMETCDSIPKLASSLSSSTGLEPDTLMAINCEYGAFDNKRKVLPLTPYDEKIDNESARPGQQMFEKMSAGLYLGEIFRLVLLDLHSRGIMFQGQDCRVLNKNHTIDTGFISAIEDDHSHGLTDTAEMFKKSFDISPSDAELRFCHRLAEIIAIRGARLSACGVAAICMKKSIKTGHVAADGSVANKHPNFKARWAEALGEILDWDNERDEDPIVLTSAEDGSGVGAAVIAAMTVERKNKGVTAGIRMV